MIKRLHRGEENLASSERIGSGQKCFQTHDSCREQSSWVLCRAFLLFAVGLASVLGMAGCSGITSKADPSASVTPIISVAITQAPPASLLAGNAVPVSATITNDPANAGVDWVAVCDSALQCGSFTLSHTASGGTTMFTAPVAVPMHNTVAVTAVSASSHGRQVVAPVIILSTVLGVTITQAPPATAPAGAAITFGATVLSFGATALHDPAKLGVDYKATCGTGGVQRQPVDCTPPGLHSDSGGTATFFVPPVVQGSNIVVGSTITITAFATADHNFSATALFTVTIPITINLTQVPPNTMQTNATAPITAVAANDTTNAGVDWQVSCSFSQCGSVIPVHTNSGQAAIFTAPSAVTSPSGVVTITAFSTATGHQTFATTIVTIVAAVSIQITTRVPIDTIVLSASAPLVATVGNDPANAGVDWTVTCGSPGGCGSFSPAHTASGATTTFTAPKAIPTSNTVTITATSTTDPSKTATELVTVTATVPGNSLLSGRFVILLTAKNSINGPFALGGFISGDGNGHITGGSLDLADASGNASAVSLIPPTIYSIGADGRGQINLLIYTGPLNGGFGVNGTGAITLSVVFVTSRHALLSETDSFGSATGTLDMQNPSDLAALVSGTGLNGTYSLKLSGVRTAHPNPNYFVAGAVTIQTSLSGYGVSAYITDQSDKGIITSVPLTAGLHFGPGGLSTSSGEITLTSLNLGLPTQFNLDLWLIDRNHLVITDWTDAFAGTPSVIVAGYLTGQPSTPSVSGTYAFTEEGATTTTLPQVAGGILTCGSTGTLDMTPLGGTPVRGMAISAACTAPANGRGLITISGAGSTGISQFAAYPTLDQGLYLIELDGGSTGTSGPSGAGVALQQTLSTPIPNSALRGRYASNFHSSTALGTQSFAGQIASDGISILSGTADVNFFNATAAPPVGTPSSGAALTGSFTAGADGRFPLALTLSPAAGQPAPEFNTINPACYIVDANTCLLLGLDAAAPGTGILQLQNTGL
jgi:hypothetical protein